MSGFLGDTMASILGGGRPGGQPKGGLIGGSEGLSMIGGSTRGRDRAVLRRAFGNATTDGSIKTLKALQGLLHEHGDDLSLLDIKNLFFSSPLTIASSLPGMLLWEGGAGTGPCSPQLQNLLNQLLGGSGDCTKNNGSTCGQFRAAMSAGDVYNGKLNLPVNTNYGPVANQVGGVGRNQGYNKSGGIHSTYRNCQFMPCLSGTSEMGASYSGNPKYVYDSSDYIRYKKLAAKNKNYNDSKFGGVSKQYPYTALAKVRH